jgi:prevent-host-death family protein
MSAASEHLHQVITITRRGKPVARLVPLDVEKPRKLFGSS